MYESLPLTLVERDELGQVPDLSIRSLACTGSGDGASNFRPFGRTASVVSAAYLPTRLS